MPSPEISPLSLPDALPICGRSHVRLSLLVSAIASVCRLHRAQHQLAETSRSEEHTSELQSLRHLVCRLPRSPLFPYPTLFRSVEEATSDYRYSFQRLHPFADYIALNISSPKRVDRKSTRLNSSHLGISYAVSRDLPSFPTRRSSDLWKKPRPTIVTRFSDCIRLPITSRSTSARRNE